MSVSYNNPVIVSESMVASDSIGKYDKIVPGFLITT